MNNTVKSIVAVLVIAVAGVFGYQAFQKEPVSSVPTPTPEPVGTPDTTVPTTPPVSASKEVSTVVDYAVPSESGTAKVGFIVTVDGSGVITDVATQALANEEESVERQQVFVKALPALLMGKNLKTLTGIDNVAGSSLTTAAFNGALAKLQAQI